MLVLTPALSPGERGRTVTLPDHFSILMAVTDSVSLAVRRTTIRHIAWLKTRRMILPLLGERAGVRADVILDSTHSPHHLRRALHRLCSSPFRRGMLGLDSRPSR